jgi:hypothetical protein
LPKHKRCGVVDEMITKSYQHKKEMSIVTEHVHQKDIKMEKANGKRTTILIDNTSDNIQWEWNEPNVTWSYPSSKSSQTPLTLNFTRETSQL